MSREEPDLRRPGAQISSVRGLGLRRAPITIAALLVALSVALSGCTTPSPGQPAAAMTPATASASPAPGPLSTGGAPPAEGFDNYPTVTGSLSPSNPSRGQSFTLKISSEDDRGVVRLSWQSAKPFSGVQSGSFDCNSTLSCSNTWQLTAGDEGPHPITVLSTDSSGKEGKLALTVDVGPARAVKPAASPTATPKPASPTPTPANTSSAAADGCSTNSDCGYKQICRSGKCESVECTTDSQCSGCRRCSDYSCRSCGYGPYGCYC